MRKDARTETELSAPAAGDPTAPPAAVAFELCRFEAMHVEPERVARLVGVRADRAVHRRWLEMIDRARATLPRLMRPRAVFRIDAVRTLSPHKLVLASGTVYAGAIGRFLARAEFVATFVVTIGSAVERLSRRWLREGQVRAGVVADAVASEAVELTAERCQERIRAWAHERGFEITPRYSPGYCGMRVDQQIPLFASLPARRIGVRLQPSFLMTPIKSVSGLIGIGRIDAVRPDDYPCRHCDQPDCMQRRAPAE